MSDPSDDRRPVACTRCGRARQGSAAELLAWMSERVGSGPDGPLLRWTCPACARQHSRDIEGRLPREYW